MFRNRVFNMIKCVRFNHRKINFKVRHITPIPVVLGLLSTAKCEEDIIDKQLPWEVETLEHDFLIRQATTVNVNAATQLLTVTIVAITDTSERLREALSKEICLVQQAMEWGEEGTPPHHWDQLVAIRGSLADLNHNLRILWTYMEYAEKLATIAAEISFLSGNTVASDAICERIDHATRTCNNQKVLTHELQQESLEIQQKAIIGAPNLEEKLKNEEENKSKKKTL